MLVLFQQLLKKANKTFWGIGLDLNRIVVTKYLSLGGNLYFWNQPQLFNDPVKANTYGTLANISMRFNILKALAIDANIGYKTKGYIQGQMLGSGFIIGLGLVYQPSLSNPHAQVSMKKKVVLPNS